MASQIKTEIERKLDASIQIISEAKHMVVGIDNIADPAVVNHLVEVIEKQSQLIEIIVADVKTGKPTESQEIDDKLFGILGDYQKLKREELKAKLTGIDINLAAEIKKRLGL